MGDDLKALPDLDLGVYTTYANAIRGLANEIKGGARGRGEIAGGVLRKWEGNAARAFGPRFDQGGEDAGEIVARLNEAADLVDDGSYSRDALTLRGAAMRENERRRQARDWLARREAYRNQDSVWDSFKDAVGMDPDWEKIPEIGAMPEPVPEPFFQAPAAAPPRHRYV